MVDTSVGVVYEDQSGPVQKKDPYNLGLVTESKTVLVSDQESGVHFLAKKEQSQRPIASITKLMTALVFLDYEIDLEKKVTYKQKYSMEGAYVLLRPGDVVTARDLFYSSLVASANNAVAALVDSTGESEREFVEKMNQRAKAMGMSSTEFYEPTGLSQRNKSTATDLLILLDTCLKNPIIADALKSPSYEMQKINRGVRLNVKSTNKLLKSFINQDEYTVLAGKTGYTEEAGYCLALAVQKEGRVVYAVVLGAKTSDKRFQEAKSVVYWVYENYFK